MASSKAAESTQEFLSRVLAEEDEGLGEDVSFDGLLKASLGTIPEAPVEEEPHHDSQEDPFVLDSQEVQATQELQEPQAAEEPHEDEDIEEEEVEEEEEADSQETSSSVECLGWRGPLSHMLVRPCPGGCLVRDQLSPDTFKRLRSEGGVEAAEEAAEKDHHTPPEAPSSAALKAQAGSSAPVKKAAREPAGKKRRDLLFPPDTPLFGSPGFLREGRVVPETPVGLGSSPPQRDLLWRGDACRRCGGTGDERRKRTVRHAASSPIPLHSPTAFTRPAHLSSRPNNPAPKHRSSPASAVSFYLPKGEAAVKASRSETQGPVRVSSKLPEGLGRRRPEPLMSDGSSPSAPAVASASLSNEHLKRRLTGHQGGPSPKRPHTDFRGLGTPEARMKKPTVTEDDPRFKGCIILNPDFDFEAAERDAARLDARDREHRASLRQVKTKPLPRDPYKGQRVFGCLNAIQFKGSPGPMEDEELERAIQLSPTTDRAASPTTKSKLLIRRFADYFDLDAAPSAKTTAAKTAPTKSVTKTPAPKAALAVPKSCLKKAAGTRAAAESSVARLSRELERTSVDGGWRAARLGLEEREREAEAERERRRRLRLEEEVAKSKERRIAAGRKRVADVQAKYLHSHQQPTITPRQSKTAEEVSRRLASEASAERARKRAQENWEESERERREEAKRAQELKAAEKAFQEQKRREGREAEERDREREKRWAAAEEAEAARFPGYQRHVDRFTFEEEQKRREGREAEERDREREKRWAAAEEAEAARFPGYQRHVDRFTFEEVWTETATGRRVPPPSHLQERCGSDFGGFPYVGLLNASKSASLAPDSQLSDRSDPGGLSQLSHRDGDDQQTLSQSAGGSQISLRFDFFAPASPVPQRQA